MKRLLLCICIFLSLIPLVLWGQTKVNKQSRGQKVAGYISLLTADSIKYGSSVKWIDISHVGIYKKLVLCIFVVTKLQEHEYQHNAKRLRRLPTRLSESALRR